MSDKLHHFISKICLWASVLHAAKNYILPLSLWKLIRNLLIEIWKKKVLYDFFVLLTYIEQVYSS